MFRSILIANRGEIACRIIRTARRMGLRCIAVFSEADAGAPHVRLADAAYPIGPARAAESYLRADRILAAAAGSGAEAIHPGYGFLSENADFAAAVAAAGLTFIGPPPAAIRAMGSKAAAKALMVAAGVPVVPGYHGDAQDAATLAAEAARIGYPVLIKASAGGGGKGMRPVFSESDFAAELAGAQREAAAAFGDAWVLLERYLQRPRHVEVQVFADTQGHTIHLHTRDCSVQRRHQKVLEEAPAPDLSPALRARLHEAAIAAARAVGYVNAGTVEFIVEGEDPFFMEMNTRLQVEHPVTEMITGLDLVEWQLRVAAGEPLPLAEAPAPQGHSVEVRLYAEDPAQDFRPATGRLTRFAPAAPAADLRIETGVAAGDLITPHYDPMLAKLVAWGPDRAAALARLGAALAATRIAGPVTNRAFLARLVGHPALLGGELDTGFLGRHGADLVPDFGPAPARALAAAVALRLATEARPVASPWARADGWRLQGAAERPLRLVDGTVTHDLLLRQRPGEAELLEAGAAPIALLPAEPLPEGDWLVSLDGRRERIAAEIDVEGEALVLELAGPGGGTWRLRWRDLYAPADAEVASEGRLAAPIPGRVVQLLVAVGQKVARGQLLAVLEAMKTELRITAPAAGVVAHLGCAVGDAVEEGTGIVTLAPPA